MFSNKHLAIIRTLINVLIDATQDRTESLGVRIPRLNHFDYSAPILSVGLKFNL